VGTHWEHYGNPLGTREKCKKKTSPNSKVKKSNATCLGLNIGCIKPPIGNIIFVLKSFANIGIRATL
jgi:hypothetical protein